MAIHGYPWLWGSHIPSQRRILPPSPWIVDPWSNSPPTSAASRRESLICTSEHGLYNRQLLEQWVSEWVSWRFMSCIFAPIRLIRTARNHGNEAMEHVLGHFHKLSLRYYNTCNTCNIQAKMITVMRIKRAVIYFTIDICSEPVFFPTFFKFL